METGTILKREEERQRYRNCDRERKRNTQTETEGKKQMNRNLKTERKKRRERKKDTKTERQRERESSLPESSLVFPLRGVSPPLRDKQRKGEGSESGYECLSGCVAERGRG